MWLSLWPAIDWLRASEYFFIYTCDYDLVWSDWLLWSCNFDYDLWVEFVITWQQEHKKYKIEIQIGIFRTYIDRLNHPALCCLPQSFLQQRGWTPFSNFLLWKQIYVCKAAQMASLITTWFVLLTLCACSCGGLAVQGSTTGSTIHSHTRLQPSKAYCHYERGCVYLDCTCQPTRNHTRLQSAAWTKLYLLLQWAASGLIECAIVVCVLNMCTEQANICLLRWKRF